MYYHRGPSRLLWFIIGAGAATWWIKRKDCDKRSFGACRRITPSQGFPQGAPTSNTAPPYPYPYPPPPTATAPVDPSNPTIPAESKDQIPGAPVGMKLPPPVWEWEKRRDWEWEQDKENFVKMSNQAADVMVDFTESTLESILSTADLVRAKLAEHRAAREQEQQRMREREEERRRNPPRLV